jgi:glycosyltransferase involved in cell wall biosynthesis
MKKEMKASFRIPEEKITIIDNPVDSKWIQSLAADLDAIQTIEEMRPYAIGIGRLVEQKDHYTAIHAIAHVNTMQQLNYVILGEGPQKDQLQALTKNLGIDKQVHFLGNRTNPYPWLKQAKIFVLPSRWEGYPNVLLEAMSLGCAIAVTKYDPSVEKILSNYPEQLHRMVSVGDSRRLATAIVELINDDNPPECSGINTVQRITTEYLAALGVPCAWDRK